MELYRTQILANKIEGLIPDNKVWPICVPSYNRPNPNILKALEEQPELPIVLFIRNDPAQKELYKEYRKRCRVVLLNNVSNIGQTRASIIQWAWKNKLPNIFMIDDDIAALSYRYPHPTKNGKLCMRGVQQNLNLPETKVNFKTLKMWMYSVKKSHPEVAISGISHRSQNWNIKFNGVAPRYNSAQLIQCVHVNTKLLKQHNINYRDSDFCGNEDLALQFDVLEAGLRTILFTDYYYRCPDVGYGVGGCENVFGLKDLNERYKKYVSLFKENMIKNKPHPGVTIRKTNSAGLDTIRFNWNYYKARELNKKED